MVLNQAESYFPPYWTYLPIKYRILFSYFFSPLNAASAELQPLKDKKNAKMLQAFFCLFYMYTNIPTYIIYIHVYLHTYLPTHIHVIPTCKDPTYLPTYFTYISIYISTCIHPCHPNIHRSYLYLTK